MKPPAVLVGFALLFLAAEAKAQDKPVTSEPIIELPKFVVTDSRELPQPEAWRYATIPGFEILTNASDRATQRLLRDFGMFRQALGHVWPIPQRLSQTTSLIICGKGNKFDAFISPGTRSPDVTLASRFLKQGTQTAIVIDFQATTLNVLNVDDSSDAATGTDSGQISVEHDKQLYREYVRYLLSQSEPRFPAWLEEGFCQIIMKMQFDKRWIEFARLEEANTVSTQAAMTAQMNALATADDPDAMTLPGAPAEDRDFNAALRRRRLIDLDKFFAVKHDSPEATNVLGNNVWAKQAYAFVHMCLYGYKGKFLKPFTTFMQRSTREPVTEAMFKECFRIPARKDTIKELSYRDMLMEIRSYVESPVYEAKLYKSVDKQDVIVPPPPLALREATQAEIGRIKGEALALAGNKTAARLEMVAAYQRGERDPNLLSALGLFDRGNGEEARGRKFLEAAYAANTTRADALLELARIRYADALAQPGAGDGRFSPAQVTGVLQPLLVARQQPPHLAPLYDLVGDTLARSAQKVERDQAKVLIEGAQLFPMRLKLVFQAALMAREIDELQAAHALADHGVRYAPDPAVKKRFADLKATFPPAPPAPEATVTPAAAPAPGPTGKK